jgi:flagellar basal-body rod protein FlgB
LTGLDDPFGIHGAALAARSRRMELIASNIANAATPGYKARDVDFAATLKATVLGAGLDRTQHAHLEPHRQVGNGDALYRVPVQPSLDGNTVELATEQVAFAENAFQYETTLSILSGRISTLMAAIRGE